jgi:hypothetical protein
LTCNVFSPSGGGDGGGDGNDITYTDVVYSPDGKSVTLYLDGGVPITNNQSRGLKKELAKAGHDYFEVVFYQQVGASRNPANDKIVRASWELMKNSWITGVPGKGKGDTPVNYGAVSVLNPALTIGQGAAILFVGKKIDRTLLAVGKLTQVNNGSGNVASTLITSNTISVTFEVAALKSGVDVADCGFFTDANYQAGDPDDDYVSDLNTVRGDPAGVLQIPPLTGKPFPIFKLRPNNDTYAHYYFAVDASPNNIGDYLNGIILAGNGSYGKRQPRYPTADGRFQYSSLMLDDITKITAFNNTVASVYDAVADPSVLQNPVKVKFDTSAGTGTVAGSVFAFIFEIPVFPLAASGNPGTWYIRASYDSYWLDLDDGAGGAGGAVLIGTGASTPVTEDLRIRVVRPPNKWRYNGSPNPNTDSVNWGRDLFVDGMVVWLERNELNGAVIRSLNVNTELTYELGMRPIRANRVPGARPPTTVPAGAGENIDPNLAGMQEIVVYYTDPASGTTYKPDSFIIVCDDNVNPNRYTNIPASHYVTASQSNDMTSTVQPAINSEPGTYVVVFTGNFDIPQIVVQADALNTRLIFLVASNASPYNTSANNPNRRIGRTGEIISQTTRTGFYIGKWPFYTALTVGGTVYTHTETITSGNPTVPNVTYDYATFGYTINADGTYNGTNTALSHLPPAVMTAFPFLGTNVVQPARLYNVTVDYDSMTILNDYNLY